MLPESFDFAVGSEFTDIKNQEHFKVLEISFLIVLTKDRKERVTRGKDTIEYYLMTGRWRKTK